ncbi:ABC transporter permease [Guptibacillus hwajinpoensis]|uniref:ABC transporter permease n=1 Tax=Guptibacillus hwajinpoensis TaxID=208199 RepID=A0A0J6FR18_9BACL|nr:ABC transporter permease [Alkalihalobacillus macyae]KMM36767.1 hypothetical protein AB986_12585 [Alkalihalobacillus macyae]
MSEFERLWSRKFIIILFLSIPALTFALGMYYKSNNEEIIQLQPDFATALNFPILGLAEHLFITFNLLLLMLIGFTVTEEYQHGHLRLLLLRSYSLAQIYRAKFIVISLTVLIVLLVYGISSFFTGWVLFDIPQQSILFISDEPISNRAMVFYIVYYYILAFISIVAVLALFLFIGIICPTINAVLGCGASLILFLIAAPQLLEQSTAFGSESTFVTFLAYASIMKIQYTGISLFLSGWEHWYWIVGVTGSYIIIFSTLSYLIFTRRSYFV